MIGIALERDLAVNGGYHRVGYFQIARVLDMEGLQKRKDGQMEQNFVTFEGLCKDFAKSANSKEYIRRGDDGLVISIT